MHTPEAHTSFQSGVTRRDLLRWSGVAAAAGAGVPLLGACTSPGAEAEPRTGGSGGGTKSSTVKMQLGWIKNMQFCGEYMASEQGYYTTAGLTVSLVAGGAAATSASAAISTGSAWAGTSKPLPVAEAINKGVGTRIIGAVMQDSGRVIMSPAGRPLTSPKELIGKKVGVALHNRPDFSALLAVNDIDPSTVQTVSVQFDPSPLVNGEVDAWDGYANNEPIVLAERGFRTHSFTFADHGLPMVAQVIQVATSSLTKERDKVKGFLTAEIRGWQDAIADPEQAVRYCVDKYGKQLDLDFTEQLAAFKATIPLVVTSHTKEHGVLSMSPAAMKSTVASLTATGTRIDPKKLFDLSIIEEIYDEQPDLI